MWWWTACLLLILYSIVSTARSYWRLRHFKGPRLAAFSHLWYIRAAVSEKAHLYLSDVCTKYGSIARIGPNTLITSDEDLIRKMCGVRSTYSRADWYRAFKFDADRENLFSEVDEEKHIKMRSRVTAGYAGKENPNLENDIDRVLWSLIKLLKSKYISSGSNLKKLEFANIIQFFTLDVITSLTLSHPFGWIENEKDMYEYVKTMEDNVPAMNFMSAVPILSRIMRIPAVQRAALPTVKDRVGMGAIKAVTRDLISRRFGPEKETKTDMTQSFIKHGLSQGEIGDESLLQILAGSDTTATIIRSGFIYIITNPQIYTKLQAECDASGVPLDDIISNARALELPYLNACVKESLRYHPAATGLMPRKVGPEGDTHNGMFFPPGTEIGFCAWMVYRHNPVYGEDASVFRPERWTEATAEHLATMEKAHELVFGYGRYKCMGEKIARIELLKTFFELMRRFHFSFLDPTRPLEKDLNYGLFIQKGMWMRVEERKAL
ncbi:hypothetical protein H2200_002170 [Cladophialophora chaetospira]|uniref:Pisatin demethylase n=1 Tax=Cladophialophora chaetospira TaxID=386627 RepID=A0AA39CMT3_9EURO|nr:hypothetical protein H2200_002170 [Cladophialophora chaetospira]